MKEITLNKEEFKLFDQYDQFGFFYNEDGMPSENDDIEFDSNVDELFAKYEYIVVDFQDNIYGFKNGKKILEMSDVTEAFDIAREVKQ
jgi:hypothetical protein